MSKGVRSRSRAPDESLFHWPIIDPEDEAAVLSLLRKPNFADSETVERLESKMAQWLGRRFAVAQASGTAALEAAFFASGVGPGTEVIAPSLAYWACAQPAARLGASIVFADVCPDSLTIDVSQVASLLTPRTRAVVAVHAHGRVSDMRRLRELCRGNGTLLIEDACHSVGATCGGKRAGSLGDITAFSMNGKVFAAGEGGMLLTDDQHLFERVLAWGLPHRFAESVEDPALQRFVGVPVGAVTSRIGNVSAALALRQLGALDQRIAVIEQAMTMFADGLDEIPGLRVNRPAPGSDETMGVWHEPVAFYDADLANGASLADVVRSLRAAGVCAERLRAYRQPLHQHAWYRPGPVDPSIAPYKPVVQCPLPLPVTESIDVLLIPRFTRFDPEAVSSLLAVMKTAIERAEPQMARSHRLD